jgi:hypothetical protein
MLLHPGQDQGGILLIDRTPGTLIALYNGTAKKFQTIKIVRWALPQKFAGLL